MSKVRILTLGLGATLAITFMISRKAPDQRSPEESSAYHGHAPGLQLNKLGGVFAFRDWGGRAVGKADFSGTWTLLYFGYSRCTTTCPTALPLIAQAAEELRRQGINAQAAFVDIEAPPLQLTRLSTGKSLLGHHGGSGQRRAMSEIVSHYGNRLLVLTGTRGQLAQAAIAFNVAREHTPPRPQEEGHSLNHSSYVYIVAPDTRVVGYRDHSVAVDELVNSIASLS